MADLEISVGIDARQTKTGAAEAKREIKGVADETEKTEKRVRKSTSAASAGMKDMQAAAQDASEIASRMGTAFGTALGVIVAGAVAATIAVIKFAKSFAAAGVEVGKLQKQTGFAAETVSALESQFRLTKTSGDDFREGMKNLTKTIGDAANGSVEAAAKLTRLGIDPKKAITDLDGSFRQILQRIVSLKNPIEQGNAAIDAFGESGYKLVPFIRSFNGDIDGLIKKLRDFGTVMSEQDVRAAQEFDKSMSEAMESLNGLMMMLGRDFLPTVKTVFDSIRGWLKENRDDMKSMSENAGFVLLGLMRYWQDATNAVDGYIKKVREAAGGEGSPGDVALSTAAKVAIFGPAFPLIAGAEYGIGKARKRGQAESRLTGTLGGSVGGDVGYFGGRTKASAPQLSDAQKEAIRQAKLLEDTIRDLNLEIQFFGDRSEVAAVKQNLLRNGIDITTNALARQAIKLAGDIDKKNADAEATKNAAEAAKQYADTLQQFSTGVSQSGFDTRLALTGEQWDLEKQIDFGRELTDMERQAIANAVELTRVREDARRAGLNQEDIDKIVEATAAEQGLTDAIVEQNQIRKEMIALQRATQELQTGLNAELAELTQLYATGAEITTVFRVEQELLKDTYKGLSEEQRQQILATASQIDSMKAAMKAQEETRRQYEDFRNTILDGLEAMQGGAGNFFSWMYDRFRRFLQEMVAEWLASKFFKMFFGGGNQQAAQQNGQGGGGIFGSIFQSIFGGGQGQGPGSTGVFNPGYFTGGGSGSAASGGPADWRRFLTQGQFSNANGDMGNGSGRGGGFGGLFSGGIFAPSQNPITGKMNGKAAGIMGGIGAIASVVGGMIPGRWGSVISMAGTGMSIGAMFGPWGAAIGAGIGALIGFFTGNKAEKRDKKEKWPQFEQGFVDSMKQLRDLINDVRTLRIDPDAGIAQAIQIRQQMASGFGIQFESKKYQKMAASTIASRLTEADALIEELRKVAEISRAAGERERRLLPEFAGGVYISSAFRRHNGMLGGAWTGRDTIPAMLAAGEMILNPMQQARVRANAGTDPFRGAGIPGYADGGIVPGGGSVNVTVYLDQDASGMWMAAAESDQGQKVIAKVVARKYANDELKLQRRGA